jgi:hypothetical protein
MIAAGPPERSIMKNIRLLAAAAALAVFAAPTPVLAQATDWPVTSGDYVEVSMIKIDDGHALEYLNYLAGNWRKSQDYAKQQGWISGYEIWSNEYPRNGEADLYLVTFTPNLPDAAEAERRDSQYREFMAQTVAQMQAASAGRAEFRHLAGSMLLRRQNWK